MSLPRTRTMEMQDVVLSQTIASATDVETLFLVSPIDGRVERVLFCRGGVHSSTEVVTLTIGSNSDIAVTLANGGAVRDVDDFTLTPVADTDIRRGEEIKIVNTGTPTETTLIGISVVVKRL